MGDPPSGRITFFRRIPVRQGPTPGTQGGWSSHWSTDELESPEVTEVHITFLYDRRTTQRPSWCPSSYTPFSIRHGRCIIHELSAARRTDRDFPSVTRSVVVSPESQPTRETTVDRVERVKCLPFWLQVFPYRWTGSSVTSRYRLYPVLE